MNHNPFSFFQIRNNFLLPRIFFQRTFSIGTLNWVCYFEAVCHCFEFVEESFLTCVFDQIESRNLLVTSMIELSDIHSYLCWKTALNAQTNQGNVPSKTSSQTFHLLSQLLFSVHSILSIRNEDDCDWCFFWHFHKSIF